MKKMFLTFLLLYSFAASAQNSYSVDYETYLMASRFSPDFKYVVSIEENYIKLAEVATEAVILETKGYVRATCFDEIKLSDRSEYGRPTFSFNSKYFVFLSEKGDWLYIYDILEKKYTAKLNISYMFGEHLDLLLVNSQYVFITVIGDSGRIKGYVISLSDGSLKHTYSYSKKKEPYRSEDHIIFTDEYLIIPFPGEYLVYSTSNFNEPKTKLKNGNGGRTWLFFLDTHSLCHITFFDKYLKSTVIDMNTSKAKDDNQLESILNRFYYNDESNRYDISDRYFGSNRVSAISNSNFELSLEVSNKEGVSHFYNNQIVLKYQGQEIYSNKQKDILYLSASMSADNRYIVLQYKKKTGEQEFRMTDLLKLTPQN